MGFSGADEEDKGPGRATAVIIDGKPVSLGVDGQIGRSERATSPTGHNTETDTPQSSRRIKRARRN
jgi:hypothetical protein